MGCCRRICPQEPVQLFGSCASVLAVSALRFSSRVCCSTFVDGAFVSHILVFWRAPLSDRLMVRLVNVCALHVAGRLLATFLGSLAPREFCRGGPHASHVFPQPSPPFIFRRAENVRSGFRNRFVSFRVDCFTAGFSRWRGIYLERDFPTNGGITLFRRASLFGAQVIVLCSPVNLDFVPRWVGCVALPWA